MQKLHRWITFFFIFCLCIFISTAKDAYAAEKHWELFLDGQNIVKDVNPYSTEELTMLPIRVIVENLGGTIKWVDATKEVFASIGNKSLYIDFDQEGKVSLAKINLQLIDTKKYSIKIVSGRTLISQELLYELIDIPIAKIEQLQLIHLKDKVKSSQLEETLTIIHEADLQLQKTFRNPAIERYEQIESLLSKYYTKDIIDSIIKYYYRYQIDGSLNVIPTHMPLTLLPLSDVEQFKLDIQFNNKLEKRIFTVRRKANMFANFSTHTIYELIFSNKKWIIVEITHNLVDNKGIE